MTITYPPGVRVGSIATIRTLLSGAKFDMFEFSLEAQKQFGDYNFTKFGWVTFYLISDPAVAHEILVNQPEKFHKIKLIKYALGPFLGNGLLTSEGDFWKKQRKLAQPAFHFKRIENYATVMTEYAQRMLHSWKTGETRQLEREMMKLTLNIVAKTLFDADVTKDADHVGELLTRILEASNDRMNAGVQLPDWLPLPKTRQMYRDVAELDIIIQRFIDARRANGEDKGDLLSMLLQARDDDGSPMSDQQLRDELMTIFLAGHETTAMALTWTWYVLMTHPEILAKVKAEVDAALGDRPATLADLANLKYSEMVLKESMRLYPPVSSAGREPIEDIEIGGYTLPKGSLVTIAIYAMHRNPEIFENPETFDPERFSPENEKKIPRYAYLPFGAGPRVCIGNSFAMMEARLILATMVQHADLTLVPGQKIEPKQLVTIRPANGMAVTVKMRENQRVPEMV
ncbi:MAG: cytochrome P450 [Anaerolineae bacterium]|nr:cytochrome P450 [Anaerolineae bacterium]